MKDIKAQARAARRTPREFIELERRTAIALQRLAMIEAHAANWYTEDTKYMYARGQLQAAEAAELAHAHLGIYTGLLRDAERNRG